MAKYRGKHEGKTRGKYVRTMLRHVVAEGRDCFTRASDLSAKLGAIGQDVSSSCDRSNETYDKYVAAFHIGGATVGLKAISYKDSTGNMPHRIDLRIVSNDDPQDVIEKVTSLPYKFERMSYEDW